MLVRNIVAAIEGMVVNASLDGALDKEVLGLTNHSAQVKPGYVFICRKGSKFDSHELVPEVAKRDPALIVMEKVVPCKVPHVIVPDSRLAEALIAAEFYNHPYKKLLTIGVTGTNGKTTCVHLFHHVLKQLGLKGSMLGTVVYDILGEKPFHADNTTPDAIVTLSAMAKTVQRNGQYFAMEVSSHALAMKRVESIRFDIAGLTNITRDHLDYHQNFEDYVKTKLHIFDLLKDEGIAVISDEYQHLLSKKVRKVVYGISTKSDYKILDMDVEKHKTKFRFSTKFGIFDCEINQPGVHFAYNASLVMAALMEIGYDPKAVVEAVKTFPGVEGRFQYVPEASLLGIEVVVDFAHSPDALEKTLITARKLSSGRVITVFGAGGQADKGKRPLMAEVVCKYSDITIITTDDPRGEDPEEILRQVEKGVIPGCPYLLIPDRAEAIETALTIANRGDMVIVAGRGHEEYQIFSEEKKIPFKDADVIRELIKKVAGKGKDVA
ncbi:UDP-N-acetylmuramoyl-L-alanyl-D-glutamate--2,6-diaminopimelate ligase [Pseudothermotoga thermarum]|uniref:UDP-N-acetylmuramyl-tripeptide synthetase n=1 Tax=Pseudothermotoga thermarum DSM 5069 TaxID=688269 RepID=F7YW84_9THEM|nr:UDP-N-acetylmuramoyl-L-alanyl-D-glutamate--2,6-diaminopimelate ligase [Pseudothermotoga thermarum]AEH51856.1 UDP-N-acetylmuramoylalanyl-D-glutamate--2,6-diaminopimelate ligase [Pseudothermotoga thermarum DSM 5069]